jgi:hypothetical protein
MKCNGIKMYREVIHLKKVLDTILPPLCYGKITRTDEILKFRLLLSVQKNLFYFPFTAKTGKNGNMLQKRQWHEILVWAL